MENWKEIAGTDGWYEVSDLGRVRSWYKPGRATGRRSEPRILRPTPNGNGYPMVWLCVEKERIPTLMHTLVLEAFVGPRPAGMECCHADGDPANNMLTNLRWDTHSANLRDAVTHGTHRTPHRRDQ